MEDYKLSKSSTKNIKGIRQEIIILIKRVLIKSPHDFGIPQNGGLRTAQQQNKLYYMTPSVTQLDGFNKVSYHQSGNAVDIFVYDEHGACWDCIKKYKEIADLMKIEFQLMQDEGIFKCEERIIWGGDWIRFVDRPHFEIR
tara:strand:+ start:420 stop:842 length:423 start_codon:yes stop_codon:yes gene_type:complete